MFENVIFVLLKKRQQAQNSKPRSPNQNLIPNLIAVLISPEI